MENTPPSYLDATSQDHWKIVAPFLRPRDLCSAALVRERWHDVFARQLWGNPASHFGTGDDTVYTALVRFRRTLPFARLYVKQWTHTLHLPPARAEIYDGPHAEWLRDVLEQLPRLQCLIVDELPFFDHSSLITLRYPSHFFKAKATEPSSFGLRLLNASGCINATYTGLSEALKHLPTLLYLDLSKTLASKHHDVLSSLVSLVNLQVLKLRGIRMRDEDLEIIAKSVGNRVRSLDVRDNLLTDPSARTLLSRCFKQPSMRNPSIAGAIQGADSWSWISPSYPDEDTLQEYQGEQLDAHLHRRLVSDFAHRLAVEDDILPGISHLYVSGNRFTAEGISGLLRSGRLRVLDVGSVSTTIALNHSKSFTEENITLPGTEKIVQTLRTPLSHTLTYLRVHHAVITTDMAPFDTSNPPAEVVGDLPFNFVEGSTELDSRPLAELPDNNGIPTEVSADSPPENAAKNLAVKHDLVPRRGSAFAPEVVEDEQLILNATGSGLSRRPSPNNDASTNGAQTSPTTPSRPRSFSRVLQEREARARFHHIRSTFFVPSMLPKLRTLVLTGIPESVNTSHIPDRLIEFIKLCAQESALACEEASLSYECPPGRNKRAFERSYAASLFALRKIVLELARPASSISKKAPQSWRVETTSKSSTEDADSEAFWSAAQDDFSFFDEEECGQPAEKQWALDWAADSMAITEQEQRSSPTVHEYAETLYEPVEFPQINVISELSKFRGDRKSTVEAVRARGGNSENIEGYWDGKLQVVRPSLNVGRTNTAKDYYGNIYEHGFRYR